MSKQTNRQYLPNQGVLWVVATPIGNLQDVTKRAVNCLKSADIILCEDTRVSQKLLSALKIKTNARLVRFDQNVAQKKAKTWVELLEKGAKIALVSDAGTPVINDPGYELISLAREKAIEVTPIPGASAVSCFLSVCGLSFRSFCFRGYFPRQKKDQKKEIDLFLEDPCSELWVWFESPQRIKNTLNLFKKQTPLLEVSVGKEMTKVHESFFTGVFNELETDFEAKGEYCFAVRKNAADLKIKKKLNAKELINDFIEFEIPPSKLAKILARHTGEKRQLLYEEIKKMR